MRCCAGCRLSWVVMFLMQYSSARTVTVDVSVENLRHSRALLQNSMAPRGMSGIAEVDPEELNVLPDGYKRELMEPWQNTSIPSGAGNAVGSRLNVAKAHFLSFSPNFASILGQNPVVETLAERDTNFAHEGPVYLPDSNEVFFTSNRQGNLSSSDQYVQLFAVNISSGDVREITPRVPVPLANGAVAYQGGIALLAQGLEGGAPGGVLFLDPYSGDWHWLINNWFGLHFNSPNDVITTLDGALWFTDPSYGSNQGFKAAPQLGEFVWRFAPNGAPARVVADGFQRPNGLSLSADEKTLYVSDTGFASGAADSPPDPMKPHTIYAFDILDRNGGQFLGNRRVFAVSDNGIPDGLKIDKNGNVYSGCGDGLNVWAANGDLIGKIIVEGGVANFLFADNDLIMLAETRVLKLHLLCKGDCNEI